MGWKMKVIVQWRYEKQTTIGRWGKYIIWGGETKGRRLKRGAGRSTGTGKVMENNLMSITRGRSQEETTKTCGKKMGDTSVAEIKQKRGDFSNSGMECFGAKFRKQEKASMFRKWR